jgi:hypothetical protein
MKLKTLGRFVGLVNAGAWSCVGYYTVNFLSKLDTNFFFQDYPLSYKIARGAIILPLVAGVPISVLGLTDGLVDIARGTHHYFGCKVWQKITRNQERKKAIDKDLEFQLRRIEEDVS